jgi:hypothetical protein
MTDHLGGTEVCPREIVEYMEDDLVGEDFEFE